MTEIKKQSGAVLVLALVMLTVLTLIGVTSMSTSTLEMKAASNSQQHNIVFQGVQSRLDYVSDQGVLEVPGFPIDFKIAIDINNPPWPVQNCDEPTCPGDVAGKWKVQAAVSFVGCGKVAGSSMESGKSFSYRFFSVVADGQASTGSARSVQAQGIRFPVAGCEEDA